MNASRLKQAMHYQLSYFSWSFLYVYGIAVAIVIAIGFMVTVNVNDVNISITGIGGVGFVHFLVMGIAGIRSDLKFYIQHGISRRTTFLSHLYASLICAIALGLFCEVFNLITYHLLGFVFHGSAFTIQGFMTNWMMYAFAFFAAWQVGALLSLIYYRLSKMQQIVFSVAAIAIIVLAFAGGMRHLAGLGDDLGDLIRNIIENTIRLTEMAAWIGLLIGLLAAAGNYLLLQRVEVKE